MRWICSCFVIAMGASAALGLSSERVRTGFSVRRSRYSTRSFVSELSEAHAMDARVKVHNLTVSSLQEFQAVDRAVRQALKSQKFTAISFVTPEWMIPSDMSARPAYLSTYRRVNDTHGAYKDSVSTLFISANPSSFLSGIENDSPEELSALGFGGSHHHRCNKSEAKRNSMSKHVVVYVSFPQCSYWGHAVPNLLPRVTFLLNGARAAGFKVSVMIPEDSRSAFSKNTERFLNMMGIDLLASPPNEPHRVAVVDGIASWDRLVRRASVEQIRSTMFKGLQPAHCTGAHAPSKGAEAWFISRSRGVRNGRQEENEDMLTSKLESKGFKILRDPSEWTLRKLATTLYTRVCKFSGWNGAGLFNLIFLPDGAELVELNPFGNDEDWWHASHALGMGHRHSSEPESTVLDKVSSTQLSEW
eukprot:CAMPEP_0197873676 /NCGR_PEP_ID=MMETSP1439-20131203/3414_1 /TAXON_ID=66791 /ORGANISM="Gonyaulax spinifera, Strain CCMP409" /LENGTH=416 /DNA_ID=CAMNT_0043492739 /DNA_START=83 /DNA_END=1331 /DNA_ORIENTATION=+